MFCTNCGNKNDHGLLFCTSCGTQLSVNENSNKKVSSSFQNHNFNIKEESSNLLSLLKSYITNPFKCHSNELTLPFKFSLMYISLISLVTSLVIFMQIPLPIGKGMLITLTTLSTIGFYLLIPGVFYLMLSVLKKENITKDKIFEISTIASTMNLLFAIINSITLRISPILFLLSLITCGLLIVGVYYVNLSSISNSKTLIAYALPSVYVLCNYIILKLLISEVFLSTFRNLITLDKLFSL